MFERLIRFAIEQRWLVIFVTLGVAAIGVYNYTRLAIDAVPDITNVQVQINVGAPGYSPLETAVSYTHLDVYKRQAPGRRPPACTGDGPPSH